MPHERDGDGLLVGGAVADDGLADSARRVLGDFEAGLRGGHHRGGLRLAERDGGADVAVEEGSLDSGRAGSVALDHV